MKARFLVTQNNPAPITAAQPYGVVGNAIHQGVTRLSALGLQTAQGTASLGQGDLLWMRGTTDLLASAIEQDVAAGLSRITAIDAEQAEPLEDRNVFLGLYQRFNLKLHEATLIVLGTKASMNISPNNLPGNWMALPTVLGGYFDLTDFRKELERAKDAWR